MGGRTMSDRVGVVCVLLGLLVLAPGAPAATVSVGPDGRLDILAGPGEVNEVVVEAAADQVRVIDARTPVTALDGCAGVPDVPSAATCPAAAIRALRADLEDGDDRLEVRVPLAGALLGGPGDDVLYAGAAGSVEGQDGDDVLVGSAQSDVLAGGPGDDVVLAGDGDDEYLGGAGADVLDGGPGRDTVRYDDGLHDRGVAVSLSGGANDGALGEGDDVRSTEVVVGTPGPDAVRGSDAAETFIGGDGVDTGELLGGDDVMHGGPGDDTCLLDGLGYDVCDGGPGEGDIAAYRGSLPMFLSLDGVANDGRRGATGNLLGIEEVIGGEGPDVLVGGPGPDVLSGRGGDDILRGGAGDDVLAGDRGADVVEGGPGVDRVGYATIFVPGPVRVTLDRRPNDGEAGEGDRIGRDVEVVEGSATAADLLAGGEAAVELRGLGGEDRLVGGTGRDVLDGGPGDDRISALDGVPDEVRCGPGVDQVVADPVDTLRGCERRGRQVAVLRELGRSPSRLRLRCPKAYRAPVRPYARRCRGAITVQRGGRIVRRVRVDVVAGQGRNVRGPALRARDVVRWRLDRLERAVAVLRVRG